MVGRKDLNDAGAHNSNNVEFEMNSDLDGAGSSANRPQKCAALRECYQSCTRPCLAESHPLPENASWPRKCFDNILCPPHSKAGAAIFVAIVFAAAWTTVYSMTGKEALPGGNLFAMLILFMACWCGGYLVGLVRLPPLLGMLLVGGVLGNAPHINVARDIDPVWSSGCRQIALTIILIRAGLGLDPKALKKLSFVVVRLAFSPCLVETIVDGIASHLILGLPWSWGFMLGFVIAAVSPAVVVPSLLSLSERGYGVDKGIPTLVIAAASIDDVLAITGFGVLLGISFSSGNIVWTLFKGPIEAIVGVLYGIVGGYIIWYIPQKSSKHLILFRSTLLLLLCMMAIFGSKILDWSGAGPLAALSLPFVAALKWRKEYAEGVKNPIEDVVGVLWMIFQPLLFGLIGAEVDISSLDGDTVGLGIAVLAIGLSLRVVVSFLAVFGTDLNLKERFFIPFAWLPKATVQAAVGAVALDTAKAKGDVELEALGKQILNLAVLSILLTAPLGAALIAVLGPMLLNKRETAKANSSLARSVNDSDRDRNVEEALLEEENDAESGNIRLEMTPTVT
ncbi:sodium/hydrogen exchanger 9B2 isoform X2 [Aplysia californica]|uniref:Sodium/hydrogen exchanger 9B2 isoform X2 n=1 Tax=Aplysia californica TaxID=6500 RepID=A0ABM0K9R0_APLCA|nr:sodium/hydrogen exchanger 9B2 isoform X2 [Aplysia californica]